jgi:steroid delta-isomerase-like uncharacterized protein
VLLLVDVAARALAPADTMVPGRLAGLPPEVWQLPGMAGTVLALFGVLAVYARQAERAGRLGFAGFVLVVVGLAVGAVYTTIYSGLYVPWLAQQLPGDIDAVLAAPPSAGMIVRGILVQAAGLGLGAILLGVATVRARVLPAAGGWLLIVGAVLAAVSEVTLVLRGLSFVGFAAAFIVLGVALRQRPDVPAPTRAREPGGWANPAGGRAPVQADAGQGQRGPRTRQWRETARSSTGKERIMSAAQTRKTMLGFYDAFNRHDLDAIGECLAENCVFHTIPEQLGLGQGRDAVLRFAQLYYAAFPDARSEVLDLLAEGALVAARRRITGTHKGEIMGIPASGNTIDLDYGDFWRCDADGKIVEHWGYQDNLAFLQQLGVLPADVAG